MGKKQHWSWVLSELWGWPISSMLCQGENLSLARDPEVLAGVLLCSDSLSHEICLDLLGEGIWSQGH